MRFCEVMHDICHRWVISSPPDHTLRSRSALPPYAKNLMNASADTVTVSTVDFAVRLPLRGLSRVAGQEGRVRCEFHLGLQQD